MKPIIAMTKNHGAALVVAASEPTAEWLAGQRRTPVAGISWVTVYPLTGGACDVQTHLLGKLRTAMPKDLAETYRLDTCRYNAAREVLAFVFA